MPFYTFRLDQFQIDDTRALHNDTDVVAISLKAGDRSFTLTQPMGDVNNGNHDVGLEFPAIEIDDPKTSITLNYTIVNAGHDAGAVETQLQKSLDGIAMSGSKGGAGGAGAGGAGAGGAGAGAAFGLSSLEIAVAMAAVDLALTLLFANCDGTVVADTVTAPISDFDALIPASGRVTTHTKFYPGTDSTTGCGGNSRYRATLTIVRTNSDNVNEPDPTNEFIFLSRSSGLVLDVTGGSHAEGTKIQQFPDNGTASQHWKLIPVDDGFFQIQSLVSGLFLDVTGASHSRGAQIQQFHNTGGQNQHWKFIPVTPSTSDLPFPILAPPLFFKIQSRLSGLVLDVPGRSANQSTIIQQYTDNGGSNQLWQLISLVPKTPIIRKGGGIPVHAGKLV